MRKKLTILAIVTAGLTAGCSVADRRIEPVSRTHHELLRHVVLIRFKEGTTPGQIQAVVEAFRALPDRIREIRGFEWGTDVSPEKLAQGYTHCFLLTFDSEADRDAYLVHPDHKAFGGILGPHLDKVLVVDYWARDRLCRTR